MVRPFQFAALPGIFFGPGTILDLPAHISKYGRSILLLTGKQSFAESESGRSVFSVLKENRIDVNHYSVPREPSPEMIDEAADRFRDKGIDAVVAIGGGSVMDAGKAVSAMLTVNEKVRDFLEGIGTKEHPGTKVPFIAVPTTSGTGSEATKNAVISNVGRNGFKRSLRHDNFVPDIALVDPVLTISCPPSLTASSGMDCFTQLVEAYLSDKSNEYSDALALRAVTVLASSLKNAFDDGSNIGARKGMSFAALTSGICLANSGLGIVHGFAASVGALYEIPHGVVCGILMAPANKVTLRELRKRDPHHPVLGKYAALGKIFDGGGSKTSEYYADLFIEELYKLSSDLMLRELDIYGIKPEEVDRIVELTENKNNPVKLSRDDMKEIILSRI